MHRLGLRSVALGYLGIVLLGPLAMIFWKTFEHGFGTFWDAQAPREQARVVHLLVERVDYDGAAKRVSITFHPSGIRALADEIAERQQEKSA